MKQTAFIIDANQVRNLVIRLAKNVVRDLTRNPKEKNVDKSEFHTALQSLLLEQARDFCCYGEKEHPLPNLEGDGRKGRIDVAWWTFADRQLAAVFEIDSTIRMKSLRKLLAADCPYRLWVYYGNGKIRDVLEDLDTEKKITVIDFSIQFEKKKRRSKKDHVEQIAIEL